MGELLFEESENLMLGGKFSLKFCEGELFFSKYLFQNGKFGILHKFITNEVINI